MGKDAYKLSAHNTYYIILIFTILMGSCGRSTSKDASLKKIEITITGLDGNGAAEKNISNDLLKLDGIKTLSFNYLNNQVVVLFDTIKVQQSTIIQTIQKTDNGRYKILDVKENKEPLQKIEPVIPNPQEDIHDDVSDEYKDNV